VRELLYLYKHTGYKSEKEIRLVAERPFDAGDLNRHDTNESQFSKLYIETPRILFCAPGSKIILGPKVELDATVMLDIRHRLAKNGWQNCKVERSGQKYR
jgi:hypothetical protein